MQAIFTARLRLTPLALDVAAAILDGRRPAGANWAPGYPTDATLIAAGYVLMAAEERRELGPWTMYQVVRNADDCVVGGMGFLAPPDENGRVFVGFSETEVARAEDLMPEAVAMLIELARAQPGVTAVTAEMAATNPSGIAVLEAAGMRRTGSDGQLVFFSA